MFHDHQFQYTFHYRYFSIVSVCQMGARQESICSTRLSQKPHTMKVSCCYCYKHWLLPWRSLTPAYCLFETYNVKVNKSNGGWMVGNRVTNFMVCHRKTLYRRLEKLRDVKKYNFTVTNRQTFSTIHLNDMGNFVVTQQFRNRIESCDCSV